MSTGRCLLRSVGFEAEYYRLQVLVISQNNSYAVSAGLHGGETASNFVKYGFTMAHAFCEMRTIPFLVGNANSYR